jgi:hypothetical protein
MISAIIRHWLESPGPVTLVIAWLDYPPRRFRSAALYSLTDDKWGFTISNKVPGPVTLEVASLVLIHHVASSWLVDLRLYKWCLVFVLCVLCLGSGIMGCVSSKRLIWAMLYPLVFDIGRSTMPSPCLYHKFLGSWAWRTRACRTSDAPQGLSSLSCVSSKRLC